MNVISPEGSPPDSYEQIGLKKQDIGGVSTYFLNVDNDSSQKETISSLRELLKDKKVAVEVGCGGQLDSLLFAGKKVDADVVIGIDLVFPEASKFKPPVKIDKNTPKVILLKGHAWNTSIVELFYQKNEKPDLALYAQLVAPDTMISEAMINMTTPLAKSFMIVLDSGAVETLEKQYYQKWQIERKLMTEHTGLENPSHLDWLSHLLRNTKQTRLTHQDYQKGIDEGKYPPTQFLRNGEMIIFEKPLPEDLP